MRSAAAQEPQPRDPSAAAATRTTSRNKETSVRKVLKASAIECIRSHAATHLRFILARLRGPRNNRRRSLWESRSSSLSLGLLRHTRRLFRLQKFNAAIPNSAFASSWPGYGYG